MEANIQNWIKKTSFRKGREDGDERQGVGLTDFKNI